MCLREGREGGEEDSGPLLPSSPRPLQPAFTRARRGARPSLPTEKRSGGERKGARARALGRGGGRRGGPAAAGRGLARARRLTGPTGREALARVAHLGGVADLEQVQPVRVPVVDDVGEFAPLLLPAAAAARHPRRARRRGAEPGPGPGPGPLSRAPDGAGDPSVPAGEGRDRLSPRPLPARAPRKRPGIAPPTAIGPGGQWGRREREGGRAGRGRAGRGRMPRVGSGRRTSRLGSACGRSPALSRAKPPLPPPFSAPGSPSPRSLPHTPAVRAPARPPALLLPFPGVCAPARAPGGRRLCRRAPPENALRARLSLPLPRSRPAWGGGRDPGAAGAGRGAARCSGSPRTAPGDTRRRGQRGAGCRPRGRSGGASGAALARGPRSGCGTNKELPRPREQRRCGRIPARPRRGFPRTKASGNVAAARPSLPAGGGQRARPGGWLQVKAAPSPCGPRVVAVPRRLLAQPGEPRSAAAPVAAAFGNGCGVLWERRVKGIV